MILPIGIAHFEFMGEFVPANVISGQDDAEPILGMIPLQSVGIEVDPRTGGTQTPPFGAIENGAVTNGRSLPAMTVHVSAGDNARQGEKHQQER